jgi:hypothetical protein
MFISSTHCQDTITVDKYMSEITEMNKCKRTIVCVVTCVCVYVYVSVCECLCKTCSISAREEYESTPSESVSEEGGENRGKLAIGCRKLDIEKRHSSYPLLNITTINVSRQMG